MAYSLRPYLNFPGTTREALEFYRSVFGGTLTLTTYGDVHALGEDSPSNDKVMHSELVSDHLTVSAADHVPEAPVAYQEGNTVNLALVGDDARALTDIFAKLSEGAEIEMPLQKQIWGDHYGALTDRFGMHWMVNISGAAVDGEAVTPDDAAH